jgi:hypothetical protein
MHKNTKVTDYKHFCCLSIDKRVKGKVSTKNVKENLSQRSKAENILSRNKRVFESATDASVHIAVSVSLVVHCATFGRGDEESDEVNIVVLIKPRFPEAFGTRADIFAPVLKINC